MNIVLVLSISDLCSVLNLVHSSPCGEGLSGLHSALIGELQSWRPLNDIRGLRRDYVQVPVRCRSQLSSFNCFTDYKLATRSVVRWM